MVTALIQSKVWYRLWSIYSSLVCQLPVCLDLMMHTHMSHISLPIFDTGTCHIKYFLSVFMSTEIESFKGFFSLFFFLTFSFVLLISDLKMYKKHYSLLLVDQGHSDCFILGHR